MVRQEYEKVLRLLAFTSTKVHKLTQKTQQTCADTPVRMLVFFKFMEVLHLLALPVQKYGYIVTPKALLLTQAQLPHAAAALAEQQAGRAACALAESEAALRQVPF